MFLSSHGECDFSEALAQADTICGDGGQFSHGTVKVTVVETRNLPPAHVAIKIVT